MDVTNKNQYPKVVIIVLNWNGCKDTLACLNSLQELDYPDYQVVVVDNASTDDSVQAIREMHPWVQLIESSENRGFVGGNNLGLEYASSVSAAYAFLLNNDTEIASGALMELVKTAEDSPEIGVVGPMIYFYDQPDMIWSAGGEINWDQGDTWMLGLKEVDGGQYGTQPRSVDFITGCAFLIRTQIIDDVGVLDPRFFAYYEEVEWCIRIRKAGYQILHAPEAKVWHKISIADREASPLVHYYMTRNRLLFLRLSRVSIKTWGHTLLLDYARTLLSWTVKKKWRHKAPLRHAMVRGICDFFKGRYGKVDLN